MFLILVGSFLLIVPAGAMSLGIRSPRERSILVTVLDQAGVVVR